MRATIQQWQDFIQSAVWVDIKEMLLLERSAIRDGLELGPTEDFDGDLLLWEERGRGKAEAIRHMVDYPQYVVDNYETLNKEEEEENG